MTDLYAIHIEELDSYTGTTKRYYMRSAEDVRQLACLPLHLARHVVANMGNDYRYRRHATAHKITEAQPVE